MLALLGPQRFRPNLRDAMGSLGLRGPVAVVTAGWQEREAEDRELQEHLGHEVVDLELYHRAEEILARDAELESALRERQEMLQELQELYRIRLDHTLEAARELMRRPGRGRLLSEQRRAAIRAVRTLDREHVRRIRGIHEAFDRNRDPTRRPAVREQIAELQRVVAGAQAICIAGGHVAVLLNRLRLFDLRALAAGRPIIAWSAGAMALAERVVLFHDNPPQGAGNAEVLDAGLGLAPGIVPLPHARRRLHLDDPVRVSLFARRFAPATCAVLDVGARLGWDGESWSGSEGTLRLDRRGRLREIGR